MKKIIKGVFDKVTIEDGGAAKITQVLDTEDDEVDSNFFIKVQSWDELHYNGDGNGKPNHAEFDALVKEGRRVTITIDTEE
jgi:hypothetical protein